MAPTSRWIGKQWPCDRFATLASELLAVGGTSGIESVVVVGSGKEREQCGPLLDPARCDPRVQDRLGELPLSAA